MALLARSGSVAKPLTREEDDLAQLLRRCGLARAAAACLPCLLRGAPLGMGELSDATGLPPQDVSVGVRDLERLGLVVREPAQTGQRGRPALRHRLAGSASQTLRRLEESRRRALLEEMALLDDLRARADRLARAP